MVSPAVRAADHAKGQCFTARLVVGTPGDLAQATTTVLGAVTLLGITQVCPALVFGLGFGWAPDFFQVLQLARLMPELGYGSPHAFQANNLVVVHGSV